MKLRTFNQIWSKIEFHLSLDCGANTKLIDNPKYFNKVLTSGNWTKDNRSDIYEWLS